MDVSAASTVFAGSGVPELNYVKNMDNVPTPVK
jgi:hypothetical protein